MDATQIETKVKEIICAQLEVSPERAVPRPQQPRNRRQEDRDSRGADGDQLGTASRGRPVVDRRAGSVNDDDRGKRGQQSVSHQRRAPRRGRRRTSNVR